MELHAITKYLFETGRPWHKTAFSFIIMNWETVDVGLVGCLAATAAAKKKIKDHAESTRLKEEKKKRIAAAASKAIGKKDEKERFKKKEN